MFFDQESPQIMIDGMIAELDISEPYQLERAAVFKGKRQYLIVFIRSCSCWPQYGSTEQIVCKSKTEVDRQLRGKWACLLQACQDKKWRIDKK